MHDSKIQLQIKVTVRPYDSKDRAAVEELAAVLQDFERGIEPLKSDGRAIQKQHLDYLLQPLEKGEGVLLVAEADGKIVGYVAARKESHYTRTYEWLYVDDLCVANSHRKQGIGSLLLAG